MAVLLTRRVAVEGFTVQPSNLLALKGYRPELSMFLLGGTTLGLS